MFLWPRHPSAPGPRGSKLQQNHSKWQTKGAGIRAQMSSMGPGQINREGRQRGHGAEDQHLLDATTEMSLQPNLSARPQPELVLIPRVCGLSPSLTHGRLHRPLLGPQAGPFTSFPPWPLHSVLPRLVTSAHPRPCTSIHSFSSFTLYLGRRGPLKN